MHTKQCSIFKALAEDLVIGAAQVADDGRFLWVNPALEQILEYTSAELLSMTWQELTHPGDTKADESMMKSLVETERDQYSMTKRYITKTGRTIWISLTVSEIKAEDKFWCFISQIVPLEITKEQSEPHVPVIQEMPNPTNSLWKRVLAGAGAAGGAAILYILEKKGLGQ